MNAKELFPGIWLIDNRLATMNLAKGRKVYNEDLVIYNDMEYRMWNPYRSKLSAAMLNGIKTCEIKGGQQRAIPWRGNWHDSKPRERHSGQRGRVYAIELSERNVRNSKAYAKHAGTYCPYSPTRGRPRTIARLIEICDVIYQDISARKQAEILLANSVFLKKGGYAYFVIKSQSIDIAKSPKEIYKSELAVLEDRFELVESVSLEPYDSMHLFAVLKKL